MKHFSHPHGLELSKIQETNEKICSGCENKLCGTANYKCTKSNCEFSLHKSCFKLPRKVQHNSRPNHPVTLYPTLPERRLYFGCNACGEEPKFFVYEWLECNFSLHAKWATSWVESVTREDHQHSLALQYQWPFPIDDSVYIFCKVCDGLCNDSKWLYYCAECKLGTHLKCVTVKMENSSSLKNEEKEDEEEEQLNNEERLMMATIRAQGHQARLNFQAQMAYQNAQFFNNMWRSSHRYY
ncbi:protein VACUOLELESS GAMETOPHYTES-like [Lycium barbarum]|uniref:protein VACUOLELESS GAMETOPHYTES-like n=1 Tax=Lycium barbarum TaxID=112863 RepID=UPI00293E091D|nr:protein VACUOLELESS GAMETOPHYTES-like [Lycium barbarum]